MIVVVVLRCVLYVVGMVTCLMLCCVAVGVDGCWFGLCVYSLHVAVYVGCLMLYGVGCSCCCCAVRSVVCYCAVLFCVCSLLVIRADC